MTEASWGKSTQVRAELGLRREGTQVMGLTLSSGSLAVVPAVEGRAAFSCEGPRAPFLPRSCGPAPPAWRGGASVPRPSAPPLSPTPSASHLFPHPAPGALRTKQSTLCLVSALSTDSQDVLWRGRHRAWVGEQAADPGHRRLSPGSAVPPVCSVGHQVSRNDTRKQSLAQRLDSADRSSVIY